MKLLFVRNKVLVCWIFYDVLFMAVSKMLINEASLLWTNVDPNYC